MIFLVACVGPIYLLVKISDCFGMVLLLPLVSVFPRSELDTSDLERGIEDEVDESLKL